MTLEDKKLLLKELSTRLPYCCRIFYEYIDALDNNTYGYSLTLNTWVIDQFAADKAIVKPYLRPLSSMTKEEQSVFSSKCELITDVNGEKVWAVKIEGYDWLNAHHFDYRGLIEKGLALEAPKGMYHE